MIRRLTVRDIPALCAFGARNYKEIKPFREDFNPDHFGQVWEAAIRNGLAVVWVSGEWQAVLGASFTPDLYTGNVTAYGQFWYCAKEGRGKRLGLQLAGRFLEEASARNSRKILMGHPIETHEKANKVFFGPEGFKAVEVLYQKEL